MQRHTALTAWQEDSLSLLSLLNRTDTDQPSAQLHIEESLDDVPNLALSSLVHGESPPLVARQSTIFVRYSL